MASEFTPELDDLFNDALELPPEERETFLRTACGNNTALFEKALALLSAAEDKAALFPLGSEGPPPTHIGKYVVKKELGRGGMGVVYLVEDPALKREVALKVLPEVLSHDPRSLKRFEREAQILATLSHENIATIHSFENDDSKHFLTLELVRGETLATKLSRGELPTAEKVLPIFLQISRALAAAHRHEIVHRDLKPANIMITETDQVKVLDFGIAKAMGDTSEKHTSHGESSGTGAAGTPGYMSPEQAEGKTLDHRTDLWALGCVLYESLSGKRVPNKGTPDFSQIPRDTPDSIIQLVKRCLIADPKKRLSSAEEAVEVFETALGQSKRGPLRGVAFATVSFLAVVLGAIFLWPLLGKEATLSSAKSEGKQVIGLDESENVLWKQELDSEVSPFPYSLSGKGPYVVAKEGEGPLGVVVSATQPGDYPKVTYLNATNGEPLWERTMQWVDPVNAQGQMRAEWIYAVLDADEPFLMTALRDGMWYNFGIAFMGLDGAEKSIYYHPDPLRRVPIKGIDPAQDGVLLVGSNSSARFIESLVPFETRTHCGVAVLLKPPKESVQAFPYSEQQPVPRDWPGMKHAQEEGYLLVPPLEGVSRARVMNAQLSTPPGGEFSMQLDIADGRVFEVDRLLRPISVFLKIETPADSLSSLGMTLPKVLYIRHGEQELLEVPIH